MAGCQKTVVTPPSARPTVVVNGATGGDGTPAPPIEQTIKADPCATRLHAICGAMLGEYAIRGRLPARLDALQASADEPLTFTCPSTGQPYAYVPLGLETRDDDRLLVLYDAVPERSGTRWAILMRRPRGRQPASLWVVQLSEPVFRAYTPRTPSTVPSVPAR